MVLLKTTIITASYLWDIYPYNHSMCKRDVDAINEKTDQSKKDKLLFSLIRKGEYNDLIKKLLEKGASINCLSNFYESPLSIAVFYNRADTVKLLLEKGADVNNKGGIVPLVEAVNQQWQEDMVKLLLVNKACVNQTYEHDKKTILHTILHKVICKGKDFNTVTIQRLLSLLFDYGADINKADTFGDTPLSITREKCPEFLPLFFTKDKQLKLQEDYKKLIPKKVRDNIATLEGVCEVSSARCPALMMLKNS